jgi:hypothetical protein
MRIHDSYYEPRRQAITGYEPPLGWAETLALALDKILDWLKGGGR